MKLLSEKKKPQHIHLGRGKPTSVLDVAKAFGHPMVHEFDKSNLKLDITCCENPFYDCEYDVVRYIKEWKEDFLRSTVEQQLKEVDEKHAKI